MMNPVSAVARVLSHSLNFPTRACRSEYWWWLLFQLLIYFGAIMFDAVQLDQNSNYNLLTGAIAISVVVMFFPTLSVQIRRLHDVGFSGWMYLLVFIPFGSFVLLVLACFPSEKRVNRWGPIPGQEKYLGPDIFSDELGGPQGPQDDPFAPGNFFGPDKKGPMLSPAEAEAQRKAEIQEYYRTKVMNRGTA